MLDLSLTFDSPQATGGLVGYVRKSLNLCCALHSLASGTLSQAAI